MQPGDIYTHTYHGFDSSIIETERKKIHSDVIDARQKGVLFDVGHGQGAFNWTVAEICTKEGFWPDIIGSDLHTGNQDGPAYDLPIVMSKFLHLGMTLSSIIKATTATPAHAIKKSDSIGSLLTGKPADVTILKIEDADIDLEDCVGQTRRVKQLFKPVAVWKGGRRFNITKPTFFPNLEARARDARQWNDALIKDLSPSSDNAK